MPALMDSHFPPVLTLGLKNLYYIARMAAKLLKTEDNKKIDCLYPSVGYVNSC